MRKCVFSPHVNVFYRFNGFRGPFSTYKAMMAALPGECPAGTVVQRKFYSLGYICARVYMECLSW